MIWHFLEVWLLLLGAFVVGGVMGAGLYSGLGTTALAGVQGRFADAIGDRIDALKTRFGLGPEWRENLRPPVERPVRQRRKQLPPPESDYADEYLPEGEDLYPDDPWEEDLDYVAERRREERWAEEGDPADDLERLKEMARDHTQKTPPAIAPPAGAALPAPEFSAMRPAGLSGPRNGVPDHLQRIRGIGRANEELLNSFGIYHFGQIAAWTPAEVRWIAGHMRFPETIENDDWIGQAIILASGGDTGYVKSADKRRAKRAARKTDPADNGNEDLPED
jgi:predicted flap endonuclease-1-like 5' DNA nuclease